MSTRPVLGPNSIGVAGARAGWGEGFFALLIETISGICSAFTCLAAQTTAPFPSEIIPMQVEIKTSVAMREGGLLSGEEGSLLRCTP